MRELVAQVRGSLGPGPGPVSRDHRTIMTVVLLLLSLGTVMIFSATSARNVVSGSGLGLDMLIRTIAIGIIPGALAMRAAQRVTLDQVRRFTKPLLTVSLAMLVLVLLPGLGQTINGAQRWLGVGILSFQPSEIAKLALVLFAASASVRHRDELGTPGGILKAGFGPALLALGLIILEPDIGTAIVCATSVLVVLVIAGMPLRFLVVLALGAAAVILVLSVAEPYRMARLTAFVDPWKDRVGNGFQSVQGQIAIGSGGLFGVGLGQSVQKIFYLPEAHTDFILAVIGEELGVLGVAVLLGLYGVLANVGLRVAREARDPYAKLIAAGTTTLITCQALLNIWVVLGIAPLTGVPLPFISYGPTSLVVTMLATGLLLNVANGGQLRLKAIDGGQGAADAKRQSADRDRRDRRSHSPGAQRRSGA